jgi:CTP:molybdopterin cytidylyltransferase MocA
VLITPGVVPYLHAETIQKLLLSQKPVAIPSFQRSAGHPAMVRRSCFPSLIGYSANLACAGRLPNEIK